MSMPMIFGGAQLTCAFGVSPSPLIVPPAGAVRGGMGAATIVDAVPFKNIMPFGMCSSPTNPTVIAATAAALGAFTPMPCTPMTTAWLPGSPTVLVGGIPAVNASCTAPCSYGGVVMVSQPGPTNVMVP